MIVASFIQHFWEYYFLPAHEPWWRGAVWGNVIAILPSAILLAPIGFAGFFWHKRVVEDLESEIARHKHHSKALDELAAYLDPGRDTDGMLDRIHTLVDDTQPGGVTTVLEEVRKLHAD